MSSSSLPASASQVSLSLPEDTYFPLVRPLHLHTGTHRQEQPAVFPANHKKSVTLFQIPELDLDFGFFLTPLLPCRENSWVAGVEVEVEIT